MEEIGESEGAPIPALPILNQQQTTLQHEKYALLIGMEYYSAEDRKMNLRGCVNDVEEMRKVLEEKFAVPSNHITTLLAPISQMLCSECPPLSPPTPPTEPTCYSVRSEIEAIKRKAKPGDFVYIHYSGHGCRVESKFGKKEDEALLLAGNTIIRDVQFGFILEDLTKKGLIVLVVLDCCHSGGQTRLGRTKDEAVRSQGLVENPVEEDWLHSESAPNDDGLSRNATMKSHWFHKDAGYHLIAACQPHQEAREDRNNTQSTMGALTSLLIKSIHQFGNNIPTKTYRELDESLRALFAGRPKDLLGREQNPMLLGNFDKIIFHLGENPRHQAPCPGEARVFGKTSRSVELEHGSMDAVSLYDRYQLFSPSQSTQDTPAEIIVVVRKLLPAKSTAHLEKGDLGPVEAGWKAKRISRHDSEKIRVSVLQPAAQRSAANCAVDVLQRKWAQHVDYANIPLELQICDNLEESEKSDFHVQIKEKSIEILDQDRTHLQNLPRLTVDDESFTEKLVTQLQHLQMYRVVANLKPKNRNQFPHSYSFSVEETDVEEDQIEGEKSRAPMSTSKHLNIEAENGELHKILKSFIIDFTNNSGTCLYVTILNLTTLKSIRKIFPVNCNGSQVVEPGSSINAFYLDIWKPSFLDDERCTNKSDVMEDRFHFLVTQEPHDFTHFVLPDLDGTLKSEIESRGRFRDGSVRQMPSASWDVSTKTIETDIRDWS